LPLTDAGFAASVLSEFRSRLLAGGAETLLWDTMLNRLREKELLKAGGRMRSDSTHILAAIRSRNRLECVGETLRHALNVLARVAPEWLQAWAPPVWYERYSRRFEDYRLPKSREARYALAEEIGRDGVVLWERLLAPPTATWLRHVPAVETLRQVWLQQFVILEDALQWRQAEDLPGSSFLIQSPYDAEARYSIKRQTEWTGYKVHLPESCDDELPHLIVNIETTPATTTDYEMTLPIQAHLAERDLLPSEHLLDSGYLSADILVQTQAQGIDAIGPVSMENTWQSRTPDTHDLSHFVIDWEANRVTCPEGHHSHPGLPEYTHPQPRVIFRFSRTHCRVCPARARCTTSATRPRVLIVHRQAAFEAPQAARLRQQTERFRQQYAKRAGVEGAFSQANAVADLRRSRYRGQRKTHFQHILIALGLNLLRLAAWWTDQPHARTRISPFAALAPA
jgi:transposase